MAGKAVNFARRLLDAPQLRACLATASASLDVPAPVFPTTRLHVQAEVDAAPAEP